MTEGGSQCCHPAATCTWAHIHKESNGIKMVVAHVCTGEQMWVHRWHLREPRYRWVLCGLATLAFPDTQKHPAPGSSFSPIHSILWQVFGSTPEWLQSVTNFFSVCLMASSGGPMESNSKCSLQRSAGALSSLHCAAHLQSCRHCTMLQLLWRSQNDCKRKHIRDRSNLHVLPSEDPNPQWLPDLPGASAGDSR